MSNRNTSRSNTTKTSATPRTSLRDIESFRRNGHATSATPPSREHTKAREAFLAESRKRRSRSSQRDYRSFLEAVESDDPNDPAVPCDYQFHVAVARWLLDLGFDLTYYKNRPARERTNFHALQDGLYFHEATCGDTVRITNVVVDGNAVMTKVDARTCEMHTPAGEPHRTTIWLSCDHPFRCSVLTAAQRHDGPVTCAPGFIEQVIASGLVLDGGVPLPPNGIRVLPSGQDGAGEAAATIFDEDRMLPVAIYMPLPASERVGESPFGPDATVRMREQASDAQGEQILSNLRCWVEALTGLAQITLATPEHHPLLRLLLGDAAPKPGEWRFYDTGFVLLDTLLADLGPDRRPRNVPTVTTTPCEPPHGKAAPQSLLPKLLTAVAQAADWVLPESAERRAYLVDVAEIEAIEAENNADVAAAARQALRIPERRVLSPQAVRDAADLLRARADQAIDAAAPASAVTDTAPAQPDRDATADLSGALSEAHRLIDELLIEQQVTEADRITATEEARRLRAHLHDLGGQAPGEPPAKTVETPGFPGSFAELLERLPSLEPHVVFTGDPDITADLDTYDSLGAAACAAWEALLALADYARCKADGTHTGGIEAYLAAPPPQRHAVPLRRFVPRESRSTMEQWGSARVFPLPQATTTGGSAIMEAHLRLPRIGMVTPRIHLLDRTHEGQPVVYVGYIGPHLRTGSTN